MRPLKSASLLAKWLLRISLIAIIYTTSFDTASGFSFNSFDFFIHLLLVIFAILLFIGTFTAKQTLTVLSALFICVLYAIVLYMTGFNKLNIITYSSFIVMSFYFLAHGNK